MKGPCCHYLGFCPALFTVQIHHNCLVTCLEWDFFSPLVYLSNCYSVVVTVLCELLIILNVNNSKTVTVPAMKTETKIMIIFFLLIQPPMSISYTRGNVRPLSHAALTCNNNITSAADSCLRGLEVVGVFSRAPYS